MDILGVSLFILHQINIDTYQHDLIYIKNTNIKKQLNSMKTNALVSRKRNCFKPIFLTSCIVIKCTSYMYIDLKSFFVNLYLLLHVCVCFILGTNEVHSGCSRSCRFILCYV